jgi:hypothetical protein
MAKRFTDTEKWKDDWYISLSNDNRIIWQWLLDNCTHSGLCKRSIGLLNMMCRTSYTEDQIIEIMTDRIIIHGSNWFIPKFIKFQYSTLLSAKPAILSVVRDIFEYNLKAMIPESFGNDYIIIEKSFENHCKMIKDKVKDKDKDKVKDKVKSNGHEKNFGKKFTEDGLSVILESGDVQRLGKNQLISLGFNDLKPEQVWEGYIV